MANKENSVSLRKIPYPYHSMMTICSDLDSTKDRTMYLEIMRFLNTDKETQIGKGVDLELGNSIYFHTEPDTFSYWNTDDYGRAIIKSLIQSGHIDVLHSYGEKANTREQIESCINELIKNDCFIEVWVDHGSALSNFGSDIMAGLGDVIDSPVFHADITIDYGIKFVSRGRVTSVIGQDVPPSFRGLWRSEYPFRSTKTILKEMVKHTIGKSNSSKYFLNYSNMVLNDSILRSGQKVLEFIRSNPHWKGVGSCATSDGISEVITQKTLDQLVRRNAFCILYTHLSKTKNSHKIFSDSTRESFRLLSEYYENKKILVTTTRRLLSYCNSTRDIKLSTSFNDNHCVVNIDYNGNADDLDGVTVNVDDAQKATLFLNGNAVHNFCRNTADNTNRQSISFPWRKLSFPF